MRHGTVLVLDGPEGWALPRLESEDRRAADVSPLTAAVRASFGLDVSVLRCLSDEPASATRPRRQVHLLEGHHGNGPRGRWMPIEAAASAGASAVRGAIEAWRRAPGTREWARPGWRDEVRAWIDTELARRGVAGIRAIHQLRVWETSQVLRLEAGKLRLYFKARPPAGAVEPPLTRFLAMRYPASMPEVLAIEPARRWLLMREAPGRPLMDVGAVERWEDAAAAIARIQIAAAGATADLTALGCPRVTLSTIESALGPLLDDVPALQPGGVSDLGDAQVATLRARRGELEALCRELDALGVPESIEHGDLWATNVIAGDGRLAVVDWEDATIAHPFISPSLLLMSLPYAPSVTDHREARRRIRAAYLAPWTAGGPLAAWPSERAERAFDLAQRVALLHYAVQFRRTLPAIETSREVRDYLPFFLGKLLGP